MGEFAPFMPGPLRKWLCPIPFLEDPQDSFRRIRHPAYSADGENMLPYFPSPAVFVAFLVFTGQREQDLRRSFHQFCPTQPPAISGDSLSWCKSGRGWPHIFRPTTTAKRFLLTSRLRSPMALFSLNFHWPDIPLSSLLLG